MEIFRNVYVAIEQLLENLWKSLESGRKSLGNQPFKLKTIAEYYNINEEICLKVWKISERTDLNLIHILSNDFLVSFSLTVNSLPSVRLCIISTPCKNEHKNNLSTGKWQHVRENIINTQNKRLVLAGRYSSCTKFLKFIY